MARSVCSLFDLGDRSEEKLSNFHVFNNRCWFYFHQTFLFSSPTLRACVNSSSTCSDCLAQVVKFCQCCWHYSSSSFRISCWPCEHYCLYCINNCQQLRSRYGAKRQLLIFSSGVFLKKCQYRTLEQPYFTYLIRFSFLLFEHFLKRPLNPSSSNRSTRCMTTNVLRKKRQAFSVSCTC